MIFDLPPIFGFLPMLVFILAAFSKRIEMIIGLCIAVILGAILTKQSLVSFGDILAGSLGSFMGTIGLIIILGAGLGKVLINTQVAHNIVYTIINIIGIKTKNQAIATTVTSSALLAGMLGAPSGSNAILAPIIIPLVANINIAPNTMGVLLHGAGCIGLFLGPFTPPVITTITLAEISYLSYVVNVGFPISALILFSTLFTAYRVQKKYEGISMYNKSEVDVSSFKPTREINRSTILFGLTMVALIVYGVIMKARANYSIVIILTSAVVAGASSKMKPMEIFTTMAEGASKMVWIFFMFLLFDPLSLLVGQSGAFDAIAMLLEPIINIGGDFTFIIISTLVGIFGISGAAVAQERIIHELFLPVVTTIGLPGHIWAIVLLVGSQITSYVIPAGDMTVQMGLARTNDIQSMYKNGLLVFATTFTYVIVRAAIYQFSG